MSIYFQWCGSRSSADPCVSCNRASRASRRTHIFPVQYAPSLRTSEECTTFAFLVPSSPILARLIEYLSWTRMYLNHFAWLRQRQQLSRSLFVCVPSPIANRLKLLTPVMDGDNGFLHAFSGFQDLGLLFSFPSFQNHMLLVGHFDSAPHRHVDRKSPKGKLSLK